MATVSSIVEAVRRDLILNQREQYDILNGNITDSATTLVITDNTGAITAGVTLEIDTELFYVRSISGTTVTVLRGQFGSTAAAHTSGAVITVNPKFPRFSVLGAINDELADLSSPVNGLFKVSTVELTFNAAVRGYNLTSVTSVEDIIRVSYDNDDTAKDWPEIPRSLYTLRRNAETDDFASGFALILATDAYPGKQLRVEYKAPFTAVTSLSDDINTTAGLPTTCNDIVRYGAVIRLVSPTEIARNFTTQQDPRADDRVPAGAKLNSVRGMLLLRAQRIEAERTRLMAHYRPRSR